MALWRLYYPYPGVNSDLIRFCSFIIHLDLTLTNEENKGYNKIACLLFNFICILQGCIVQAADFDLVPQVPRLGCHD